MRQEILLFLSSVGSIAQAAAADPTPRQQQQVNETPSPIPRPTGSITNSSSSLLTPQKLEYFRLGMEYAALELCGLDPFAKTDVTSIQPSYCLFGRTDLFADLTELEPNEIYVDSANTNWTAGSVHFSLRAMYTGLFHRGILPEAIREWVSKEPLALLGIGNLAEEDKRAIGELLAREEEQGNATRTAATAPGATSSSISAEVMAQMAALENWDRHRRSGLTTNAPAPTAGFGLGNGEKAEIFLVLSSALPKVFGGLDKPRSEADRGAVPKSGMITEAKVGSPFVGGEEARVLWFDAQRVAEMSDGSSLRVVGGWGWWAVVWGVVGFVCLI